MVIYHPVANFSSHCLQSKTQVKIPSGMQYKGVIRRGGQATTMLIMASLPGQKK